MEPSVTEILLHNIVVLKNIYDEINAADDVDSMKRVLKHACDQLDKIPQPPDNGVSPQLRAEVFARVAALRALLAISDEYLVANAKELV